MAVAAPSHDREASRAWLAALWAPLLLVILNFAFRFPALLNAGAVHSDAAIVGLQAEHLLRGEWSWFLWGAGYQGVPDVLLLAGTFAVFGASPLVLMLVPLATHVVLVLLAYSVIQRYLDPKKALLLCLPLVFTPQAINGVALYVPRQACITLVFAAVWSFDRAASSRRWYLYCVLGAWMCGLALYADLYALQLVAPVGVFALLAFFDKKPNTKQVIARLGLTIVAAAIGLAGVWYVRRLGTDTHATPTGLSFSRIGPNFQLLKESCLPWVLAYKVFIPGGSLFPQPWNGPGFFAIVQKIAAGIFGTGLASAALFFFARRVPWELRRLGLLGLGAAAASLAGFLVSTMPSDMWSARYLAPIVWMAPFALAPLGARMTARGFAVIFAPYLACAAVGGWLSFGPFVEGPLPVRNPRGQAIEERRLGDLLRQKGVRYAAAQYWLSYRLGFLWHEEPAVVPLNPYEDRYAPYREAFDRADTFALVFHPSEPRARPGPYEAQLRTSGVRFERIQVDGFTALIVHRR